MQQDIAKKLESLRKRLTEMEDAVAWGPESAAEISAETDVADGKAGESGAENVSDVNDSFDDFMLGIAASLQDEYELSSDEAFEFIFDVAASLSEDGSLPEIPEEEDLAGTAEWLGKAKSMGFGDLVSAALEGMLEEEPE